MFDAAGQPLKAFDEGSQAPVGEPRVYRKRHLKTLGILFFFAGVFALVTTSSLLRKAPTFDEAVHLFAGYAHLKWGDFRVNPEHPPLAKALAALPLAFLPVKDPRPVSSFWEQMPEDIHFQWSAANEFTSAQDNIGTTFFYARIPMIGLAILLGVLIYRWAYELYGLTGALAALFFYALDPNILAHGPMIHTDIPVAFLFFAGTFFFTHSLAELTWFRLLLTALCFALALITKHSALVLLPIWGVLGLVKILSKEPMRCLIASPEVVKNRVGKSGLVLAILSGACLGAYLGLWAAYGFRFHSVPGGPDRHFLVAQYLPANPILSGLVSWTVNHSLLPEAWIFGLLLNLGLLNRQSYLLGEVSNGSWFYFPVAFMIKTPLPELILIAVALFSLVRSVRRPSEELYLLIPVLVYFTVAVFSKLNIGFRHLLPIYPFLFVIIGGTLAQLWGRATLLRVAAVILCGWQLAGSVFIYPHNLAFFNELIGGPRNGYKFLVDSNLDWGQDLSGLRRWMDGQGVEKIYLAYFGTADPALYGIDAVYLPGTLFRSQGAGASGGASPRFLAVSATYLVGLYVPKGDHYRSLRSEKPAAVIGHSIFVYDVSHDPESIVKLRNLQEVRERDIQITEWVNRREPPRR